MTAKTYTSVQTCDCGRQCPRCDDCAAPGGTYCGGAQCNAETYGGRPDEDRK